MLARHDVIQGLLALFEAPRYLEIGVSQGKTFHNLNAAEKVAVDPKFKFDLDEARKNNPNATYLEVTSDEYFGTIVSPSRSFDVIYLDGLHTAEQTLRDFINALNFLRPNGIIVIDDTKPPTHLASLPDMRVFKRVREYQRSTAKPWMGDVYRVVYFIETFVQQFSYRTVAENHGQTIVWRMRRPGVKKRSIEQVGRMTFEEFVLEKDSLALTPYEEIVHTIKAEHQRGTPGR